MGADAEVAPVRIAESFLFIALHMICVRRRPDAPTIPPTATRRRSLTARPAIAPATPLNELSSEMVMGISAPPTRIAKINPKKLATKVIAVIITGRMTLMPMPRPARTAYTTMPTIVMTSEPMVRS